ncbi:hypothetical protein P152DRAFT_406102 [Eremomyces bilateralis CBS 781.70]|uniref:Cytochrome c oxidase assembly protein n=1 Tax=Eremomyces bilateralis CBS 781.70 TaxID=1392243 RepID=A0A6G1FR06_9PEZI|nr:uncharacterized protein P152DRAFT_406102 [Eremomyces bilateralis CBS 781.70]KAF1808119.1 hypothetical protein P152DRAFT_406102 [Eremomyces bilateralis CBS 781.70]
MSAASKATIALTSLSAIGIVIFVHYGQHAERSVMHQGVIRDLEQQKLKAERQLDFDMQRALEKEYKKVQDVQDTTHLAPAPKT